VDSLSIFRAASLKRCIRFNEALYDKRAASHVLRIAPLPETPMLAPVLVSLRANAVLIALCVGASDAAWLAACGCTGHPQALEAPLVRVAILASAAAFVLIVRRLARLAFDAARASRRIAWSQDHAHRLVIAHPSSDDWLVQLHVELHPARARRQPACATPHAVRNGRVPRGRA
jgi:hypothetical protein